MRWGRPHLLIGSSNSLLMYYFGLTWLGWSPHEQPELIYSTALTFQQLIIHSSTSPHSHYHPKNPLHPSFTNSIFSQYSQFLNLTKHHSPKQTYPHLHSTSTIQSTYSFPQSTPSHPPFPTSLPSPLQEQYLKINQQQNMRNKQVPEQPAVHPQTRRVILINNTPQLQPHPQSPQQGFQLNPEGRSNENLNFGNRQQTPSSMNTLKQLPASLVFAPERGTEYPLVHSQMEMMISSLLQLSEEVSGMVTRLDRLETKFARIEEKADNQSTHSKKKPRRRADQINKNFFCPDQTCRKAYGSEVSLNLHLRLKHPERARQSLLSKEKEREREKMQRNRRRQSPNPSSQDPEQEEEEEF